MHESTCQKSWRIHNNKHQFSDNLLSRMIRINGVDYPYNLFNNIVEINGILDNIQWEGQCPIIVDNESRIDTLSSADESDELAIISYLACFGRKGRVE